MHDKVVAHWKMLRQGSCQGKMPTPKHLLQCSKQLRPPVDINAMIDHLGVALRQTTDYQWAAAARCTTSEAVIWVNGKDSPEQRRFAAAHELGHLLLHWQSNSFRDYTFNGGNEDDEANRFAFELLLPKYMVSACIRKLVWTTKVGTLARRFAVTERTMSARLNQLL